MRVAPQAEIAEWRMLIDGELTPSSSGATFDNVNPYTEEFIGVVADGVAADFDRAVKAARRAFDATDWATNHAFRAHCLRQLHAALERHKEAIRPLLVSEVGTPVWLTRDTLFDVPIERLLDCAELAETYPYEIELPELDFRGVASRRLQRREPIGVVAVIVPWNGPWGSALGKIGPALASGNTVVLKPSPDASWMGTILGRLAAEETDLPPGVLNVVTSADNLMGEVLPNRCHVYPNAKLISRLVGSSPSTRPANTLSRDRGVRGLVSQHQPSRCIDRAESLPGRLPEC